MMVERFSYERILRRRYRVVQTYTVCKEERGPTFYTVLLLSDDNYC
jgi:hypothetical protein